MIVRTRLVLPALVFAAVAAGAPPAFAGTLRVPRDHGTIQEAVDAAQPGDTILLTRRRNAETVVVSGKTDLVIRGRRGPVLDAEGDGACLSITNSTTVTVIGLVFSNAGTAGVDVAGSSDVVLSRCRVKDSAGAGIGVRGGSRIEILRCRVQDVVGDGIVLSAARDRGAVDNSALERNVVLRCGGRGIATLGSGNRLYRNRVARTDGDGIVATDTRDGRGELERNIVTRPGGYGLVLAGTAQTAFANRITRCGTSGVSVAGEAHVVDKNSVIRSQGSGLVVSATGTRIVRNRVVRPLGDGVVVTGDRNLFESNAITRAGDTGVLVEGYCNDFFGNRATRSDDRDLDDTAGNNTYRSNVFPDQLVHPEGRIPSCDDLPPNGDDPPPRGDDPPPRGDDPPPRGGDGNSR